MATYSEMVTMVRDWSNRNEEVLSNANIKTFLQFGADNAYRNLRIAPLEATVRYDTVTAAQSTAETNTLDIPQDAIEFIQLRKIDGNSLTGYVTYDAKADIRSFYNEELCKYEYFNYTRERNQLILYPNFAEGDQYELFYYRRLGDVDARYDPTQAANREGIDTDLDSDENRNVYANKNRDNLIAHIQAEEGSDVFTLDPNLMDNIAEDTASGYFYLGKIANNWLRDENEKVLLFGALAEAFDFLAENEQSQKYHARFEAEIHRLNMEDKKRMGSGGNVQVHYESFLI